MHTNRRFQLDAEGLALSNAENASSAVIARNGAGFPFTGPIGF
jgi:hypothetical protein